MKLKKVWKLPGIRQERENGGIKNSWNAFRVKLRRKDQGEEMLFCQKWMSRTGSFVWVGSKRRKLETDVWMNIVDEDSTCICYHVRFFTFSFRHPSREKVISANVIHGSSWASGFVEHFAMFLLKCRRSEKKGWNDCCLWKLRKLP